MVLCFALPPSCVLVESIIASVYAIPANRDRIRALGLDSVILHNHRTWANRGSVSKVAYEVPKDGIL